MINGKIEIRGLVVLTVHCTLFCLDYFIEIKKEAVTEEFI